MDPWPSQNLMILNSFTLSHLLDPWPSHNLIILNSFPDVLFQSFCHKFYNSITLQFLDAVASLASAHDCLSVSQSGTYLSNSQIIGKINENTNENLIEEDHQGGSTSTPMKTSWTLSS